VASWWCWDNTPQHRHLRPQQRGPGRHAPVAACTFRLAAPHTVNHLENAFTGEKKGRRGTLPRTLSRRTSGTLGGRACRPTSGTCLTGPRMVVLAREQARPRGRERERREVACNMDPTYSTMKKVITYKSKNQIKFRLHH
jgi:hypothetical protein